jgi:PEP-CTERM motif
MSLTLRTWILCAVGFATLGLPPAVLTAAADPVTILSGTAGFVACCSGLGGGEVHLKGTDGFRFDAFSDNSHLGSLCDQCREGEFADFSAILIGSWFGMGSFRGRDLRFNSFQNFGNASGQLVLGGSLVLPHLAAGPAQVSFPAGISGSLSLHHFATGSEEFEFGVDLSGSGIGTISGRNINGVTFYDLGVIQFDFGPASATPEPASLVLLGTGLGVGWWQRRRRAQAEA